MSVPPRSADTPPTLALVAAIASNGVIGARGSLPWRLPDDLRHFRGLTTGHAIVMGRKTWESIGHPLPDRQNIVVTRQPGIHASGIDVVASLELALACVRLPQPVYCIGGGDLYTAALPLADQLYLTEIGRAYEGDTFFPEYDRTAWREIARDPRTAGEGFVYAFVIYERIAQTTRAPITIRQARTSD